MNYPFRIAEIINRYISGAITNEEKQELEAWLAASTNHQSMLNEFSAVDYGQQQTIQHTKFNLQKGFLHFIKNKKKIDYRRTLKKWTSIAALFICLISIAILLLLKQSQETIIQEAKQENISPGYRQALLILANGEKIHLQDSSNFEVNEQMTKISVTNNRLEYASQDTITASMPMNILKIPRGGEFQLLLSDGTRVWLNAETELKYPVRFSGDKREVLLTGEAYFEVTKDARHPFVVKTKEMNITVLGTSFNVKAYEKEVRQTTLIEGKVLVSTGRQERIINPGEQTTIQDGNIEVREVATASFIAWTEQRFVFMDELLEDVLLKLERWYDISFFIQDKSVQKYRFTGNLPKYENLDEILKKLELTTHIRFVQKGRTVTVMSE